MNPERRDLVIGSGVGGITLALLLARAGRPVTLAECRNDIGGYLRRFVRRGMYFDTGYHFTGGFTSVMPQMAQVLGIAGVMTAKPISQRIVLEESGHDFTVPAGCGHEGAEETLCAAFPRDAGGLHRLFEIEREVWRGTQMTDLRDFSPMAPALSRYDTVTLSEVCGELGLSPEAVTAACNFATCSGSYLSEAPMSFHARVGFCLHDDLSRPDSGGDALIGGFLREAEKLGIEIRTGVRLLPFDEPDSGSECHTARFSDGTVMDAGQVFFAVHPQVILEVMPRSAQPPSFLRRFARMKETSSFFIASFLVDESAELETGLLSYFSVNDLDRILAGNAPGLGIMLNREPDVSGRMRSAVSAFCPMTELDPAFSVPHRERLELDAYQTFKREKALEIEDTLVRLCPSFRGRIALADAATPLTCLDYDPPTGSAYGVRCVCGQARVCGRLPVSNFFAAGQSALVPGVLGTMLASFAVFRAAAGEDVYRSLISSSGIL